MALQSIKSVLRDFLGLPPRVVLAVLGLAAHLLLNLVLGRHCGSAWGLVAPLALGLWIETSEIRAHYRDIGLFAPGNDPFLQIVGRHAIDVLVMLLLPLTLIVWKHLKP